MTEIKEGQRWQPKGYRTVWEVCGILEDGSVILSRDDIPNPGWRAYNKIIPQKTLLKRYVELKLHQDIINDPVQRNLIVIKGEKVELKDLTGKKLASFKLNYDTSDAINISDWKASEKGFGHGKELLTRFIAEERPDVYMITTDGLTEKGKENILKALPEFKIIIWRRGAGGAVAVLMRQDAIDYYLDNTGGRIGFVEIDPKLHS